MFYTANPTETDCLTQTTDALIRSDLHSRAAKYSNLLTGCQSRKGNCKKTLHNKTTQPQSTPTQPAAMCSPHGYELHGKASLLNHATVWQKLGASGGVNLP